MANTFEKLWRGVRESILTPQSTLSESARPAGVRRRALAFSLGASILIWLTLSLSENHYLSVEYKTCASESEGNSAACVAGLSEDSILTQPLPDAIRATLYGPGINLLVQRYRARYSNSPITFNLDQELLETRLLLQIPEEVSIESIAPERIDFQKEVKMERRIPIESRVTFMSLPQHFFMSDPELFPDTVKILGPGSVLNNLKSWPTTEDTIFATTDSVQYEVRLSDSLAGSISLQPARITIKRTSLRYTEGQNKQVRVKVEGIPNASRAVQLDPESVTITYQVPVSKFPEVSQSDRITAVVYYNQIFSDTTGRVEPEIKYPPEFMLRQVTATPKRLRYFINIGQQ